MARPGRRLLRAATIATATFLRTAGNQRAAAISYHVLFSFVPFLALLVSVVELVLPESTQERIVSWVVGLLPVPADMADSVADAVERSGPPATLAGAIALVGLVWGASGMMASIRSAFRAVWDEDVNRPYVRGKALDIVLVLGAGILVVSGFGLTVVVQVLTETSTKIAEDLGRGGSATQQLGSLTQLVASAAIILLGFLLLYRVVPPVPVRIRDVLPAAAIATVAFEIASAGFAIYLDHFSDFDEVYGPLGAVLAFLLLVYIAAMILVYCACLGAAWPLAAVAGPPEDGGEGGSLRRRVVQVLRGLVSPGKSA